MYSNQKSHIKFPRLATSKSPATETGLNRTILRKLSIMAAILPTVDSDLEILTAAYYTWGTSMDFTVFVEPNTTDFDTFSTIKMQNFHSNKLYTVGDIYQIFQYLHEHSNHPYNWLFISVNATYVNVDAMNNLIAKLDPKKPYYLGHSSSEGGTLYCNKNSGILLSKGLLEAVTPRLSDCAKSIGTHTWDENLGDCIKEIVGVACNNKTFSKVLIHALHLVTVQFLFITSIL